MTSTLNALPSATTYDVESLVTMAWHGTIRVPRFQRDFRWTWEDVRRLFDSIVKHYPIGSLLLWVRHAEARALQLGALEIDAPETSDALWVVDGQQRITSLANALNPAGAAADPTFQLAYDLRSSSFVHLPNVEDPLIVPLPVLFNLKQLIRWFNDHPGFEDYLDQASEVTRTLRQFEVPVYQVTHDDQRVLQDIFDRMNNYGKRLSRAEIFSALNAGEEDGRLDLDLVAQHIKAESDFGTLDGNTVLQSVLARRGADVKRDVRDEFTKKGDEGEEAAYQAGEEALRRAVAFLQHEAHVPHFALLAYHYLLVPLARLFAYHPDPDSRNRTLLRRWYWRAAVLGPQQFKAGTGDAARLFCSRVRENDLSASVQDLLGIVSSGNPALPNLRSFATNQASTKIVLCSWWAAGPRNPDTRELYGIGDLADCLGDRATAREAVRYLVPTKTVPENLRSWAANRLLMPALEIDEDEVGGKLMHRPPPNDDTWPSVLESHAIIPDVADSLRHGAVGAALEARQAVLEVNLRSFLQRMCEWSFEDTPPLEELILDEDEGGDADEPN
jgi:hypothetical protein